MIIELLKVIIVLQRHSINNSMPIIKIFMLVFINYFLNKTLPILSQL